MANSKARGNNIHQNRTKQNQAMAGTKSGTKKSQDNMQAGSGGRGGHRRRKGGSPEG